MEVCLRSIDRYVIRIINDADDLDVDNNEGLLDYVDMLQQLGVVFSVASLPEHLYDEYVEACLPVKMRLSSLRPLYELGLRELSDVV